MFQQIPWLTIESLANRFKRAEPDCFCFAGFQDGEVGQSQVYLFGEFVERHLALRHHDIEVYGDRHGLNRQFLFFL